MNNRLIRYLKNKQNTRRIKPLTIDEAHEIANEIERLNNIIKKAVEYIKKHLEDKKYLNEIYTDGKVLNIVLDILNGRSDE